MKHTKVERVDPFRCFVSTELGGRESEGLWCRRVGWRQVMEDLESQCWVEKP